jgi:hypothetical protein
MRRNSVKWIAFVVVVLALLAGAFPIVQARNRLFYPDGQEVAAPFLH